MKKITVLLSISHKSPNGLSSFVSSFIGKEPLFKVNGIDLSVFSRECYKPFPLSDNMAKRRDTFKKIVFAIINCSSFLTVLYDYFIESRGARTAVDKYLASGRNDDLIHCQEYQTCFYLLKRKPTQKVLLTIHSNGEEFSMHYTSHSGLNSWLGKKYLYYRFNYILKHVAGIGHVSENSQKVFANNHPEFDKSKLFYVYNGIPTAPYSHNVSDSGIIRFFCVGSLSDRKNQLSCVKAIQLLKADERAHMELILVGDGEARNGIEKYISDNNIINTKLLGICTNIKELLKNADVFILASKDEGLPISIVEAMREGLPIIGSRVAGIPEQIIDGKSGYIIGTSPESVADAMKKMLNKTSEELLDMGKASYQLFTERFTENIMFDDYRKVYNNVIDNRGI